MYNLSSKERIVKEFVQNVDSNLDIVKSSVGLAESMRNGDSGAVKFVVQEMNKVMVGSVPEGIEIPQVSVYTSMGEDGTMIRVLDLILRNKYSSNYEFKMKDQFVYEDSILDKVVNFFKCSYIELVIDALVNANLSIVNEKLAEIGKAAGNSFTVSIVSPLNNEGKKIVKLTDEEIVYVADDEKVFQLDDILVLCEPTEYLKEEQIQKGIDAEVVSFAEAQTAPQFIGVHNPLVSYICTVSRLVKPHTLIKKIYSKDIMKTKLKKVDIACFKEGDIFAGIAINEDGREVILQPFNVKTLESVDYDLSEVLAK